VRRSHNLPSLFFSSRVSGNQVDFLTIDGDSSSTLLGFEIFRFDKRREFGRDRGREEIG